MARSILFVAALAAYAQTCEVRGTVTETGAGCFPEAEVTVNESKMVQ